ncbi:hypothetical protein A3C96_00420 [Candidatus Uhrbacteria bacterium RIFCSPHIGHO2_02_FULL_60_10]|uniref:Cardiolipin synthase N-terminal domain-containing protein n=1 Tax=Candidatus Uhrbacteria bacterium RIFCSPHIGHO2_02_FULL_60_10 TaxID=1802392 RepID=A0A1F7U983_9BACT|nr:MAG: hypothetical protein A3C96_00420 [Candidatus Uhrbacteria bacterium RIFCSPHIGHO2_02_FULL_60_10]
MTSRTIGSAAVVSAIGYLALTNIAFAQATCKVNGQVVPCDQLGEQVGGFIGLGLGLMAVVGIIGLATTIFWILMLVHAATHPVENRAMWIILMIFTGILGAAIYYFVVKRKFNAAAPVGATMPSAAMAPPQPAGAEPPLAPQLTEYVRNSIQQGMDKEAVRKALLASGWNPNDVERALR